MDSCRMKPLDQIKHCIENQYNFVLQGGAGSGKTETLKQSLTFISDQYPNKKVACITHTNLAADEILSRVGEGYSISTIHSFLNLLIKDYKKNIHQVIYEIFKLKTVQRKSLDDFQDDKALKKAGLTMEDMDIIELNEAFSSQALACIREWGLKDNDPRINPNGGAIALGHPLGVSGTRILQTAAIELKKQDKKYALVTMCIGVGQGYATIIEKV